MRKLLESVDAGGPDIHMLGVLNQLHWALLLLLALCALGLLRRRKPGKDAPERGHALYRSIVERVSEGILVADALNGQLIEANPGLLRKLGYSAEEITALKVSDVLVETAPKTIAGSDPDSPTTLARTTREVLQRGRDGRLLSVDVSVTAIEYQARPAVCYVIRDATPRKVREDDLLQSRSQAERRADFLAHRDALTGLPNRQSFRAHLRKVLKNSHIEGTAAVLLLDLSDFSSLNDTMGAHVGDAVLAEVAHRLKQQARNRGYVARVGNDEFAVALHPISDPDAVARTALELQAALAAPMQCLSYELDVAVNVGISLWEGETADVDALLSRADLALSRAKSEGLSSVQFFNSKMNDDVRRRLDVLLSLRHALENDELTIHYQPIVEIKTRKILALEALVRWQHPRLGMVPPADFIGVAEQSGLIVQLGEHVLRLVCKQIAQWRASGVPTVPVAVNVSPHQFQHQSMSRLISGLIAETGIETTDLAIEITEGSLMRDADTYIDELRALRGAGVRIVVDDFGTGYSSLSYLQYLPLDTLKIDRSFIGNVDASKTDEAIVSAILAMARSLDLKVVAEGVENPSHLAVLARYGCEMAQGNYFGCPLPAEQCVALFQQVARATSFTAGLDVRTTTASQKSQPRSAAPHFWG